MKKLKVYLNSSIKLALLISLFSPLISCALQKPDYDKKRLKKKIISAFRNEHNIDVTPKSSGNTLHIYIPTSEEILKVSRVKNPEESQNKGVSFLFVNCSYNDRAFIIEYAAKDLPQTKQFYENVTFNFTNYAQGLMRQANLLLQDIRTDSEEHFNFFVIWIADIARGIRIKEIINEADLKMSSVGALPWIELNKRLVMNIKGDRKVIGNQAGTNMDYTDILLKDFINDLVSYTLQSARNFNADLSIQDNIVRTFYRITSSYQFEDYKYLKIKDILSDKTQVLFASEVEKIAKSE